MSEAKRAITKRRYNALIKQLDELYWDCNGRYGYRAEIVSERAHKILKLLDLEYKG